MTRVLRLIWPPRSLVSGQQLAGPGQIEPELWAGLQFLTGPVCSQCGVAFELDVGKDQSCASCLARPPAFDSARAAVVYDDVSRSLVLGLKYGGRRDGLALMANWMAMVMPEMIDRADLLIPVPLHYTRLIRRGFNQSVWLAAALSRRTGKPFRAHALKRIKATPTQAGLSATGRRRNVRGAFSMSRWSAGAVKGRSILLVDDVFTTGATAESCARALRKAGAVRVDIATVARVARPSDATI